ncbi:MAG: FAD-dependent oxidoreductase [Bacteroidia bacterium]|nr:FAD-dependent oxidoreductase [Bacteroidia bacterium]
MHEEVGDFFVNATGPWADILRQKVRRGVAPRLRLSRGSHLVIPSSALPIREGFLIPRTKDGRVLFALPWLEDTLLVGTTDVEVAEIAREVTVPPEDEEYLLLHLNEYFRISPKVEVQARFAGLRALVAERKGSTAKISRRHVIEVWKPERFLSVLGGKWTTFRKIGEDAIQAIAYTLGIKLPSLEMVETIEPNLSELEKLKAAYPNPIVRGEPFVEGEVRFWIKRGMAKKPADVVDGRWQMSFIDQSRAEKLKRALEQRWCELCCS